MLPQQSVDSAIPGRRYHGLVALVLLLASAMCAAQVPATLASNQSIADLSIEELSNIQITSVSKKPQRLLDAAASVFVITQDEIARSGAATIVEALRLAPNVQVAQVTASAYAVSARGMNGSANSGPNKLLVLIDGRSVYSPLFSGVFWDVQDVVIEDIERIEVISGPGATLWGVNAVNGVINVITRNAAHTGGRLAALGLGRRGADAAFRLGAETAGGVHYRVSGKLVDWRHLELATGAPAKDAWRRGNLAFRADWQGGSDQVMVEGNAYKGNEQQPPPGAIAVTGSAPLLDNILTSGANITARWNRTMADGSSINVQAYVDRTLRHVPPSFSEQLNIADLQVQHRLAVAGAHAWVWGASARASRDRLANSQFVAFLPASLQQHWTSLFAQDEITLHDTLLLTAGARIERNDYTGNEFLPSMRLAWKLDDNHLLWGALSRTVRAPSRLDRDAFIPGKPPFLLDGGKAVVSEVAQVAELGVRGQVGPAFSYALTMFHNDYDKLRTQELAPSQTFVLFDSKMTGRANGIELWGNVQASKAWRLSAGMSALHEQFTLKPGSTDTSSVDTSGKDPAYSGQLRSSLALSDGLDLDIAVRRVAALHSPDVPAYTALDARLGWQLRPDLNLSLALQNINGSHAEYSAVATRSEVPRSIALRLVWR
jgi:iron complex outermembrane receptor protein